MPEKSHPARRVARSPIASMPRYFEDEPARRRFLTELFDGSAVDYDFFERLLAFGSGSWYRRDALRRAGLTSGMRVLDIATGTGLVAREAARLTGKGGSVIGLDPSAGMLAQAARLRIPLVRALGERLPCADASFDFVSMGFALRHVADLDALCSEIRRVLKPGGVACILEITRPGKPTAALPLRLFMTRVVPALARITGRRGARPMMDFYWDTIDACVPPEAVLGALERAGFTAPRRIVSLGMFSEYVARR